MPLGEARVWIVPRQREFAFEAESFGRGSELLIALGALQRLVDDRRYLLDVPRIGHDLREMWPKAPSRARNKSKARSGKRSNTA